MPPPPDLIHQGHMPLMPHGWTRLWVQFVTKFQSYYIIIKMENIVALFTSACFPHLINIKYDNKITVYCISLPFNHPGKEEKNYHKL